MATVDYTFEIDEADKRTAEQIFKALGLTLSEGLMIYLKTVIRKRKVPFMLSLDDSDVTAANVLRECLAGCGLDLEKMREERNK